MVVAAAPKFSCLFREAAGGSRPVRLDKIRESSSACAEGVSGRSTKNNVVNTVGGAGGVSSSVPPDLVPSGTWLSRLSAKGVAAVDHCGKNPSPTGSSAAGGTSVVSIKPLASRWSERISGFAKSRYSSSKTLSGRFRPILHADVERSANKELLRRGHPYSHRKATFTSW